MHLRLLLSANVNLTLEELCDCYERIYGNRVGVTTMHNTLKRLNLTRKRKTFRDPKRYTDQAEVDKRNYDAQVESVEPDNRLYLEETGSYLNMTPAYGRSPQGQRAYAEKPTSPGISVGTIALLSVRGIVAACSYVGSMTAQRFVNYVAVYVLPVLATEQVVIMDRHPVHYAQLTQDYLESKALNGAIIEADQESVEIAFSALADLRVTIHSFIIPNTVAGKTIEDLQIRAKTGATVIAVCRQDRNIVNPPPSYIFESGDAALVIGESDQIKMFEREIMVD